MLNQLRKGAGTWVAKIFIGLLVISFAVWGIADIFTGYGNRVLAKVGEVEISPQEYERIFQNQLRRISAQSGRVITAEQARTFGLDRQVLNSLITNAAVSSHARELGLGISDRSIRDEIVKSPVFKGPDGKFSRLQFEEVLRNNNMNEATYVAEQRVGAVRDQLVLALSSDLYVPQSMRQSMNRYDNDTRTLEYFILPTTSVGKIENPDEKTQQDFLNSNKQLFTAPEYRKTGVLTLSPEIVKQSIKVTDEDIKKDYAARIDQFSIPGKRHIRRMTFIDREKAREARRELEGGADFMAVAKKYGFREKGTDLGFIDKTDLFDPKVANMAFSLKEGSISQPIEGSFSSVIVQVVAIRPGVIQKKLADVREEIRTFLIKERALEKLEELHDTIEDERAGGKSLKDIASDLQLKYTIAPAIDRAGLDMEGKKVTAFPVNAALLRAIFESDIGVDNDPVENEGGIVNWFEVLQVIPERLKTLAETREQLIKIWKERQKASRLSKLGNAILADLRKGKKLHDLARKHGAKILRTKPFKRAQEHDDIPAAAVAQSFVLPLGGVGMSSLPDGKGRVIFRLVDMGTASPPGKEQDKLLRERIGRSLENDIVAQYVASLRKSYGVTINQPVLQRLNGVTQ